MRWAPMRSATARKAPWRARLASASSPSQGGSRRTVTRSTWQGTPRSPASRSTESCSASASGRSPWLTWTRWTFRSSSGTRLTSTSASPTESAPPETAAKTVSPPRSIPARRRAARTIATRLRSPVAAFPLEAYPHLSVLEVLLLPHGHCRLEGVDGEVTGLEGLGPVRRGDGDHDARLADLEPADPVDEGDLADARPALAHGGGNLAHLRDGHGRVGLVLEILDAAASRLVPDHAREEHDASRPRVAHRRGQALLGERADRDLDPIAVRAAAHGGEETDLIAGAQRVAGLHVVGAKREQRERAVRLEDREAARHRLPGCLDRAALGDLQLDVIAPGRLAIAGEEPNRDLHTTKSYRPIKRVHMQGGDGATTEAYMVVRRREERRRQRRRWALFIVSARTGATSRSRRTTSRWGF